MFERCVSCDKEAQDDAVIYQWCSKWEHRLCAGISVKEYNSYRGKAIMLINLSIVVFSNFYNFANYSDRFYLRTILKIMLDLMLTTLETANIYYQLSGYVHIICNKLPFAVTFLVKNLDCV